MTRLIIWGIAAAAVIAGVLFALYSYNSALEHAAKLEKDIATITDERDGWADLAVKRKEEAAHKDTVLKARETDRSRLQRERDRANASLAELRRDQTVVPYLDAPIPDAVLLWLREPVSAPAETRPSAPAVEPDGTVPEADIRWQPERGSAPIR